MAQRPTDGQEVYEAHSQARTARVLRHPLHNQVFLEEGKAKAEFVESIAQTDCAWQWLR
ncbi:hypothetical protein [Lampropedia aestuarii]|uniref:hypothetical protein n=1 Tax=Lampropedia aestuarii TaxID=2562762 RepID=UPI002468BA0B|nr:hypothetical protein [Lampropedia aestuarii]MDH5858999.1 hypothetical protein [Lampropedia aestuarii]